VLSEFGGIAVLIDPERSWAYSNCATVDEFAARFHELMQVVRSLELLAGFCYTQFADTYQEANGLLNSDRSPKISLASIAEAVTGKGADRALPPEPRSQGILEAGSFVSEDSDATLVIRPAGKR
jgi:hypothetical protein